MTVKEFINELEYLGDPDAEIRMFWHSGECEVDINTYNGIYYLEEGENIDDEEN